MTSTFAAAARAAQTVAVTVQPNRLIVHGTRPTPEPGGEGAHLCQLLALEIDHGEFERVLDLPQVVNPSLVTKSYEGGLLRLQAQRLVQRAGR